jgi:hypothetical protein
MAQIQARFKDLAFVNEFISTCLRQLCSRRRGRRLRSDAMRSNASVKWLRGSAAAHVER